MSEEEEEPKVLEIGPEALSPDIAVIGDKVRESYVTLSSTFSVRQRTLSESEQIAENLNQLVKLSKEQFQELQKQNQELKKQSQTDRNRFYVVTFLAILAIIVAIILAFT